MPEKGVDPINIAAHIYLSLQELTAREISAKKPAVVTVGRFQGGQAPNIIPEEAVLEGTIRTFDRELTARIMERIQAIAENTAVAFRGSAQVEEIASAPPLVNDPALMEQVGATDLWVPRDNFRTGLAYLAQQMERTDTVHKALMAYNMGPSGAAAVWERGIYESEYSQKIMERAEYWAAVMGW